MVPWEASPAADIGDVELVRQLTLGSEPALATLYDRHGAAIFRIALRLTDDRGAAEEVVQETFLVLWNRAELFDERLGSLGAWLGAIARNRSLDRVRAVGRRLNAVPLASLGRVETAASSTIEWLVASGEPLAAGQPEPSPEVAFATAETRAAVAELVAGLPDSEREAIVLAYRDGLTQSEIADRLGWPLGTVKTRSRRALRRMRDALDPASATEASTPGAPRRIAWAGVAAVAEDVSACCWSGS